MKAILNNTRVRLVLLVLMALVPALGLILFTGMNIRQQALEKVQTDAKRLIKISAMGYKDSLVSGQQLLTGLAQLPQVHEHQPDGCNSLFKSMLKEFPEYTNLAAADTQGNVFCSGITLQRPLNIADRDYFKQVMSTGKFSVSNYMIGRVTNKSTIIMAHPSVDAAGKIQAVIIASLDLSALSQTISSTDWPSNSVFFIIDSNGVVLVRNPEPQRWVGKMMIGTDIVQKILIQKAQGTIEAFGMDNIKRLYAFQPIQNESKIIGYMAIGIPLEDVYAEANLLQEENLISLGIVALVSLFAAWLLGDILIFRQIRPLLHAAERWTAGEYQARIGKKNGPAEFVLLSNAFDRMAEAVTQREEQIRLAEREAAENATRVKIQKAIIDQREKERLSIARDLHDGPVQEITGVTFTLYEIETNNCPRDVAEKLEEIRSVLKEQINELRSYTGDLRPPALSHLGLSNAIRLYIETYQNRHPDINIRLNEEAKSDILPEEKQIALFRILQEVLTNITKHAHASKVIVQLSDSSSEISLKIQDNGVGFVVPDNLLDLARSGHLGLVGIQERVESIDGEVVIQSTPGQGTAVCINVPRN